ncbi:MAG TPA: Crp/Fnr family transcriptional regulator [Candidatus Saccharimonadales bacterium]|jgi:CRP-like cAMP-binding protein
MAGYAQSPKIRDLFTRGQPLSFDRGDIILGNEAVPDGIYYISTGYVKCYSISKDGDEYMHIIYGSGEIFPLLWAYLDVPETPLFYEAISTCSLWRIAREWFGAYMQKDLELCYAMSVQLAQQFRMFTNRVDNLEYKRARDRLLYRLLYLASRFGTRDGDGVVIEAPLTHEIFASSINLSRESVSREMEKLYKEKLIERTNGTKIRIVSPEMLRAKLSITDV